MADLHVTAPDLSRSVRYQTEKGEGKANGTAPQRGTNFHQFSVPRKTGKRMICLLPTSGLTKVGLLLEASRVDQSATSNPRQCTRTIYDKSG